MTHCPICHQKLIRSTTLVEGSVVLGCRGCGRFLVEGSEQWVNAGPELRDTLALLARNVKHDKSALEQAMNAPWTDPRWDIVERLVD